MTAFGSSMQGRFRAILIRAVNVGTMIKQELHRFLVPVFGGFTQGGTRMAPIVVWFVNIAVIFEEEPRGPRFGQEPSRPPLAARGMRHVACGAAPLLHIRRSTWRKSAGRAFIMANPQGRQCLMSSLWLGKRWGVTHAGR